MSKIFVNRRKFNRLFISNNKLSGKAAKHLWSKPCPNVQYAHDNEKFQGLRPISFSSNRKLVLHYCERGIRILQLILKLGLKCQQVYAGYYHHTFISSMLSMQMICTCNAHIMAYIMHILCQNDSHLVFHCVYIDSEMYEQNFYLV